ncbi:MAG TPA: hypothetical protein VMW38_09960 [Terriglobia bacterium]|nr:hypothetical protein [Terriglobia bacterium]
MKPYLYILAVLLVGGGIGYYIGEKSAEWEKSPSTSVLSGANDSQVVQSILQRQAEAYSLHDALMLLRDCASTYVEIDGTDGEVLNLQRAQLYYYEVFRSGKSVNFTVKAPDIKLLGNLATVRAGYFKTSEAYEKEGIKGKIGEGLWILAKNNGRWQIASFAWTEEGKR